MIKLFCKHKYRVIEKVVRPGTIDQWYCATCATCGKVKWLKKV